MTENHLSNAAGRLWLMYKPVYDYAEQKNSRDTICKEMGVDSGDVREWMKVMADTWEQTDLMQAAVGALDDPMIPVEELLSPVWAVRRVLSEDPMGANNNAWVRSIIDKGVLAELRVASRVLAREAPEPVIDEGTLDSIMQMAADLIKLASSDDSLDVDARALIIEYAKRILAAATEYNLRGPGPLIAEFNRFMGAAAYTPVPRQSKVAERLWQLMNVLVLATSVFTAPVDLGNAVEAYHDTFVRALPASVEAPGEVIDAEIVDDDA